MSEKVKVLGMEDYPEEITAHVRDPKVWKENGRYYMVLGARERAWDTDGHRKDKGCALIYSSDDKRNWEFEQKLAPEGDFGYMWECPDLFELDGERILSFCPQGLEAEEERFQNIYQSGYSLLSKEGGIEKTFAEWDMGFDFYAPQTFRSDDGRRIMIGWAGLPDTEETHRNLSVENGWQHCLTFPRELTVKHGKVYQNPVKELYALGWQEELAAEENYHWAGRTVRLELSETGGRHHEIRIGRRDNGLTIRTENDRIELSFCCEKAECGSDEVSRCGGGRKRRIGRTVKCVEDLTVIIDNSIVEVFVNGGELVFTTRIYLESEERDLTVHGAGKYRIFTV